VLQVLAKAKTGSSGPLWREHAVISELEWADNLISVEAHRLMDRYSLYPNRVTCYSWRHGLLALALKKQSSIKAQINSINDNNSSHDQGIQVEEKTSHDD